VENTLSAENWGHPGAGLPLDALSPYVIWPSEPPSTSDPWLAIGSDACTPPSGASSVAGFATTWFHASVPFALYA
jgi:hypothetical protein